MDEKKVWKPGDTFDLTQYEIEMLQSANAQIQQADDLMKMSLDMALKGKLKTRQFWSGVVTRLGLPDDAQITIRHYGNSGKIVSKETPVEDLETTLRIKRMSLEILKLEDDIARRKKKQKK